MIKIYSHESIVVIHNLKNILSIEGIACRVKNDLISSGAGEVPPIEAWPEIWIEQEAQAEQARALIEKAVHGDPSQTSWFCHHCSETNAPAFETCWQCGEPREAASES